MPFFRFVDLFAGLGGFHVALKRLGGECVFAAEWQPHLQELYETNHGIRPAGDITALNSDDIPDHDVLTAGFPCQPFSKAGDQLGFECTKQGQLFFNVETILKDKHPQFFILENVPNLLKHDAGRTMRDMLARLRSLGYWVAAERLSPHQFGIPQIRERVYIVGSLKPVHNFQWPMPEKASTSIEHVLDKNPAAARSIPQHMIDCLDAWNDFLRRCPEAVSLPSYPLWSMEWGADYPYEDETPWAVFTRAGKRGLARMRGSHGHRLGDLSGVDERWALLPSHARDQVSEFPRWKKNFIRQNREFYGANKRWIDRWMPKILPFPSSHQKLEWNIKGGAREIYSHVIQFRASGVRIKRGTTAPSLVAMNDTQVPIIGWERRYMTPRECSRLQSLEELVALPAAPRKAFAALGNAVNTQVVERVARQLFTASGFLKSATHPSLSQEGV